VGWGRVLGMNDVKEREGEVPASSVMIALPTGWVAPVTTQTKPYCLFVY
jgi:hypothetical protein